jgi:Flp pilus assembly protein CpaB
MRAIKPNTRRKSLWRTVLLTGVAIVVGGAGTVAGLASLKVIDPAKLAFWKSQETIPAGWVPIPVAARTIPAYTMVSRDDLKDPKTGQWLLAWRAPDAVPKGVITDMSKIRGRITARQKAAPYFFYETDFLPEGTRPGIVAGIPSGKRAITLDASNLQGVFDLKEGDHVDLLASVAVDMPGTQRSGSGGMVSSVLATPSTALLPKRSYVKPLVQDGVVVTPVRTRLVPIHSSTLMQGSVTRTIPVQEIVLAVDPAEVAPLAEAMDLKYEITCVARSGRPADVAPPAVPSSSAGTLAKVVGALTEAVFSPGRAADPPTAASAADTTPTVNRNKSEAASGNQVAMDITPGLDPLAQTRFMEVMVGTKRQFVLFTGPGNSPVVALEEGGATKAGSDVEPASAAAGSKQ